MSDSVKTRIPVASILANDGNPREDFGDIDKLAASFRANGGEPFSPVIVVPEPGGGCYRLVDGERRWRAMQSIGTEECDALVFETMGDAEEAVAIMVTDDKRALSDAERLRGFQTMMAVGVSDEDAASVTGYDVATVRRARRYVRGPMPEQATLTAAIAAADDEFSDEERRQILDEGTRAYGNPEAEADRIRKRHERDHRLAEIREHMPEGVEYSTGSKPYNATYMGLVYLVTVRNATSADAAAEKYADAGELVAFEDGIAYALYRKATDEVNEREAKEAAERQVRDEHVAAYAEAYKAMCRWATEPWLGVDEAAWAQLRRAGGYHPESRRPELCTAVCDWLCETHPWASLGDEGVREYLGATGSFATDEYPNLRDVCCYLKGRHNQWGLLGWSGTDVRQSPANEFAEVYDALVADGWEPTEVAQKLREMCMDEDGGDGDGE